MEITFWKDREAKTVDPFLYSKVAEGFAEKLYSEGKHTRKDRLEKNKRTQIRKFFDEVVRYNNLSKTDENKWDTIMPLVHMLTAKAAYAQGRGLTTPSFTSFIKNSVNQVNNPQDLDVFANFFEAFMGYYRLYE